MRDFADNSDRDELSDIAFILLGNKHDVAKTKVSTATVRSSVTGSAYTKNRGNNKSSTLSQPVVSEDDL
jgi:hypothetical protein